MVARLSSSPLSSVPLDSLIACPECDTLHRVAVVSDDARAYCRRCGTLLIAPRADALARIAGLSMTAAILMVAAIWFPFLDLAVAGHDNRISVMDAVMAFSSGPMVPLSFAVAALIVLIPSLRLAALLYAIGPLAFGRPARTAARPAFRLAEALRPWSMAEIFILGVTVALVKVAGLATVTLGPAFWAFVALVLVTVLQDTNMCRQSIWKALETTPRS